MTVTVLRKGTLVISTVLLLGCLAGLGNGVAVADSTTSPTRLGTLALNQVGSGRIVPPDINWPAFEISLPAGDYEVRAWGANSTGGYLDTVVYLYGPRNGLKYPSSPRAVNDDENPTPESSAALRATVLDGIYQILVTSYRHAYTGTFNVVACPPGQCAKAIGRVPQVPDLPRAPG